MPLGSMSFRVERTTTDLWGCAGMATPTSGVDGAVKGGRSPAKRTLEGVRNANTLRGLGLVAAFRGQRPSPSGGKDFTALGGGARGGGARRARYRHRPGSTRNDLNPAFAREESTCVLMVRLALRPTASRPLVVVSVITRHPGNPGLWRVYASKLQYLNIAFSMPMKITIAQIAKNILSPRLSGLYPGILFVGDSGSSLEPRKPPPFEAIWA
jgi:hypothetical protein